MIALKTNCNVVAIYYYLCQMHGKTSTVLKSVTAICLMALLLFIHGVKLLHTHDHNAGILSASYKQLKGQAAITSAICSICSFEYERDAALPDCTISIQPPVVFLESASEFLFTIPARSLPVIVARGPPAIA